MEPVVHILGAGIAGLTAGARLARSGRRVVVYESAPRPGGRCRSHRDPHLDRLIDNGSHLVLSGNRSLLDHAARIGAAGKLRIVAPAVFPFHDLRAGIDWTLRPGGLWPLDPKRRVPGTRFADYLAAAAVLLAGAGATAARVFPPGSVAYRRLWEPLIVSALNGRPERVSARLFAAVVRETLGRGEAACRPVLAPDGLASAFVDPAVARIEDAGGSVRLGARVDAVEHDDTRAVALQVCGERIPLGPADSVVVAVPPWRIGSLLPWVTTPPPGEAIVNGHYRLDGRPGLRSDQPFLGLIGGTAEWVFQRGDVLSVTVSAADALAARPAEEIAATLWGDVARALGLSADIPVARVVKEKRATFDQTPDAERLRPGPRTRLANLFLAGDWTATGLPATLEGAARSGDAAAELAARA